MNNLTIISEDRKLFKHFTVRYCIAFNAYCLIINNKSGKDPIPS